MRKPWWNFTSSVSPFYVSYNEIIFGTFFYKEEEVEGDLTVEPNIHSFILKIKSTSTNIVFLSGCKFRTEVVNTGTYSGYPTPWVSHFVVYFMDRVASWVIYIKWGHLYWPKPTNTGYSFVVPTKTKNE